MWIILLLLFTGCQKYYVEVYKERVSRETLASTFAESPDPRQKNPPHGEKLLVTWRLPKEAVKNPLILVLQVVREDFSEVTEVYPVDKRRGLITYGLEEKKILTYRASIQTLSGDVVEEWTQALWFSVIREE